jgi:hypothetical protein
VIAILALGLIGAGLFTVHLSGRGLFIGDSDRLNTFLNVRKFEVESLQAGGLKAWNEFQFMGMGTLGLPYMFPDPLMRLMALFPSEHLIEVAGWVAAGLMMLAAWSAYVFIRDSVDDPFAAFVGAAVYPLSSYGVLRIGQVDSSFLILVHMPLGLLALKRVAPGRVRWPFAGLAIVVTCMFLFSFVQEIAYAILLFGAYALYRGRVQRSWRPPIVLAMATAVALVTALPRIVTMWDDLRLLDRWHVSWAPNRREILRFFYDGIFGRYHEEARLFGDSINLHEGLLLYTSTFTALLVAVALVRFRGQWFGMVRSTEGDLSFHAGCFLVVLAAILTRPGQKIVDLVFAGTNFLHARLSVAALLSVCYLATAAIAEARSASIPVDAGRNAGLLVTASAGALAILLSLSDGPQRVLERVLGVAPMDIGDRMTLLPLELTRVIWSLAVGAFLLVGIALTGRAVRLRWTLVTGLGLLIVMHTFAYAWFKLYGDYTWSFPVPFKQNNFLTLRPSEIRIPSVGARRALHERLETDRFRSVVICDPNIYAVFCAPHVAQFWRLRLLDGYVPGVPRRLASFPWPRGVRTLRAISFASVKDLPWPLLALLNVKYAVPVNAALYYNVVPVGVGDRVEASPADVEVIVNPVSPTPREFFAASVQSVATPAEALVRLRELGLGSGPVDVTRVSVVEGLPALGAVGSGGAIRARYDQDSVEVVVEPLAVSRVLILNELYHPRWRAFAGTTELAVYPANVVMRGIVVPPGVSRVELRFTPFLRTSAALWCFAAGFGLWVVGAWEWRRE